MNSPHEHSEERGTTTCINRKGMRSSVLDHTEVQTLPPLINKSRIQLVIKKCMIFLFLILKGLYASICLPKLSFFSDHVWNGLPAHQPWLPTCGDCKVELKHLFADVATLTEPDQPGHKVRALLDVHLIVGVSPELIHKLQLPLLCVEGDFPFNEEALPLFIR